MTSPAERHAEMLANRLAKRARHLRKWAAREDVTCYRLYDRDIPEVPLVVDWYEGRLHVSDRAPEPVEGEDRAERDRWLSTLLAAAARSLGVADEAVFAKRRERQRGGRQYGRVGRRGARFVVGEGGLRFLVNLSDYIDTGLFLDHRPTRRLVREEARGRRVLNLFAYTGSFTVYAAAGGALSTTSVDLSHTYLGWAAENLRLNGIADEGSNELVRADFDRFLHETQASGRRYDLVVVDAPSFSNSKSTERSFDVQRDHAELLGRVLAVTERDGVVYFATNRRRFRLEAAALAGVRVDDLTEATVPEDFRDRRAHRCYRLARTGG